MEKAEDKTADLIRSLEFSQAEIQDLKNEVKVLNKFTSESSPRDSSVGLGVLNEDAAGCVTLGGASSGGASSGESTAVARATTTAVPLGGAGCTSGGAAPGKRDQESVVREGVDQEGVDREGVRTGNDSSAGEAGGAIQPQQKVLRNRKKK
ncbi:hypothetical protein Pcinc_031554 [Petrolisthes cinctipes]|uniref:Uncharacterized protein n=1 Tax=Petrolisthes cinctipes TaxID=88211 RepID=A0AAE1EW51_PETCI|nr:hypothetical protein Pcinc_031554 [Petrolisthes cinctipes]